MYLIHHFGEEGLVHEQGDTTEFYSIEVPIHSEL